MAHKKTIAIIGATGSIGSAIAKRFSGTNNRLLLMSDDIDQLTLLEEELKQSSFKAEIATVTCAREASWEADIIIVATSTIEGIDVAEKIREVAIGKIVVSVAQPSNGQVNISNGSRTSEAEELQEMLPYSKIVKTFNTELILDQQACKTNGNFSDAFIAGNNGGAVDTVAELGKNAGLNPIPVGDLSASRTVEKMHLKIAGQGIKTKSNWKEWWKGLAIFGLAVLTDLL